MDTELSISLREMQIWGKPIESYFRGTVRDKNPLKLD